MKKYILLGLLGIIFSSQAVAKNYYVTTKVDKVPSAGGDTDAVCEVSSGDSCSLRYAIDAANNRSGADTIILVNGETYENLSSFEGQFLEITDDVTIQVGSDGTGSATIDANKRGYLIYVNSEIDVTLKGLTLVDADTNVIYFSGSTLTIKNSNISDHASDSSAIYVVSSNLVIEDSAFDHNVNLSSDVGGGNIYSYNSSISIQDSSFTNNIALTDGGVIWLYQGSLSVENSVFSGNTSYNVGGAFYVAHVDLTIDRSSFYNNESDSSGGAIYAYTAVSGKSLTITNSTFSSNQAQGSGGGIYISASGTSFTGTLSHLTFVNNTEGYVTTNFGGGIHLHSSGVRLSYSVLVGNVDYDLYCDSSSVLNSDGYNILGHVKDGCISTDATDQTDVSLSQLDLLDLDVKAVEGVSQYYYPYYLQSPLYDGIDESILCFSDGGVDQLGNSRTDRTDEKICDIGAVQLQCTSSEATTYCTDEDGDGFGSNECLSTCEDDASPEGYVDNSQDCDDADGTITNLFYRDSDGDGYGNPSVTRARTACGVIPPPGYSLKAGDCDDTDATVNSSGVEVCDGSDNDCDGAIDENTATDASNWYKDKDKDGYGDLNTTRKACDNPSTPIVTYVSDSTDCDDNNSGTHPGASETCDTQDNDCDGSTDEEATDMSTFYQDSDNDGYGNAAVTTQACFAVSDGSYVSDSTDCDDTNGNTYPGASELCDTKDNDCDGTTDEDTIIVTWYLDQDGDGYGVTTSSTESCSDLSSTGYSRVSTDCNDSLATSYPGATEVVCDGVSDNDCNSVVDSDQVECITGSGTGSTDTGSTTTGSSDTGGQGSENQGEGGGGCSFQMVHVDK